MWFTAGFILQSQKFLWPSSFQFWSSSNFLCCFAQYRTFKSVVYKFSVQMCNVFEINFGNPLNTQLIIFTFIVQCMCFICINQLNSRYKYAIAINAIFIYFLENSILLSVSKRIICCRHQKKIIVIKNWLKYTIGSGNTYFIIIYWICKTVTAQAIFLIIDQPPPSPSTSHSHSSKRS